MLPLVLLDSGMNVVCLIFLVRHFVSQIRYWVQNCMRVLGLKIIYHATMIYPSCFNTHSHQMSKQQYESCFLEASKLVFQLK